MTETVDAATMMAARAALRQRMGGVVAGRKGVSRSQLNRPAATTATAPNPADTQVRSALKKLNMQPFPHCDEVIMHKDDGTCLVFKMPKVGIAPHANCTQVTGQYEVKDSTNTNSMMDLLAQLQSMPGLAKAAQADDNIPDLVEDFEAEADKDTDTKKIEEVD